MFLCAQWVFALNVSVDRSTVYIGQSLVLTIESSQQSPNIDTTPLSKDFNVLGRSSSSQTRIVNGNVSSKNLLSLRLAPKRLGDLVIPKLGNRKIGQTEPVKIKVLPSSQSTVNDQALVGSVSEDFFFLLDALPKSVYVGESFLYRVHFYVAADRSTDVTQENIEPSEKVGAKLSSREKQEKTVQVKGRSYYHLTYNYFLTGKKTGKVVLPRVYVAGHYSQLFSSGFITGLSTRVPFSHYSPKHLVEIKPLEESSLLPSRRLKLTEKWEAPDQLRVGDSIKRIIKVEALDFLGLQIPEISYQYPTDLKVYPKTPDFNTQIEGKKLVGSRVQADDLVPVAAGRYVLGAIGIPWWNTVLNRKEIATIPTRVFNVEGVAKARIQAKSDDQFLGSEIDLQPAGSLNQSVDQTWGWVVWLYGLLGGLGLVVCFWVLRCWQQVFGKKRPKSGIERFKNLSRAVGRDLKRLDYVSFRSNLVGWSELVMGVSNRYNLYDVAALFDQDLAPFFRQLEQVLYQSKQGIDPQLRSQFMRYFKQVLKRHKKYRQKSAFDWLGGKKDVREIFK